MFNITIRCVDFRSCVGPQFVRTDAGAAAADAAAATVVTDGLLSVAPI